jgi:hypothetical protein
MPIITSGCRTDWKSSGKSESFLTKGAFHNYRRRNWPTSLNVRIWRKADMTAFDPKQTFAFALPRPQFFSWRFDRLDVAYEIAPLPRSLK